MNFAHPSYLWLFLLFIPAVVWYIYKHRKAEASLQISSTYAFDRMGNSYKKYLRHLLFLLRLGAVACLIIVLARPQSTNYWRNQATEGIDIVISLDISSSMLARDFQPDRIEAAKDVASQFISGRPTDNIGLVIFAGESFTLCPMTTDRTVLLNMLKEVKSTILPVSVMGLLRPSAVSRTAQPSRKRLYFLPMEQTIPEISLPRRQPR